VARQIDELAAFVATTTWDDVPASVQHHTKLVLLDTLGVILAGAERPEVRRLREQLGTGSGATVYARAFPSHDPRTAALLNGIAGRSIELCEGLRLVSGQAAVQVLPGVLAAGEQARSSGRDMLVALLLAYDVAARLAGGFTPRPLAHQNGQVSLLAAAAAGARLRGLDTGGISRAVRLATTLLLTPSYTNAVAGATALNVAGGMSGFAAVLAPELALAGFQAQDDAVEQALGELVGSVFSIERVLDELGSTWHITRNYFSLRVLQPDPSGARLPATGSRRIAAAPRRGRAYRRCQLSVCCCHAQSRPAELLRFEIFAAACGRHDAGAGTRGTHGARRYGGA
jgi:2-methylcitrate dehydratase PrpD